MRNILITGGAGFIGSNFVRFLLNITDDVQIFNLDALTYAGSLENLKDLSHPERHFFIHGDICNQSLVNQTMADHQISTIVHFAAETHVDRSISSPELFVQTNILGTCTLLEAARQSWLVRKEHPIEQVRFHHVSTDEVFGTLRPGDPAFCESTPYAPTSPYSASKASSDHLVRAYHLTYGLPITISNCSNNYGPNQYPEKLIPLMILNATSGQKLPVYGDGKQVRDWLYVEDHCDAIWKIITTGRNGETYNIGGDNQPTNNEVIQKICSTLDERLPYSPNTPHERLIQNVTDRPGHDRRYAINIGKIRSELGWQPKWTLGSGLEKTIDWYLGHPEWIMSIRQQANYRNWMNTNYEKR
jgi:dTDP-glucose 4,6-dehydratase